MGKKTEVDYLKETLSSLREEMDLMGMGFLAMVEGAKKENFDVFLARAVNAVKLMEDKQSSIKYYEQRISEASQEMTDEELAGFAKGASE